MKMRAIRGSLSFAAILVLLASSIAASCAQTQDVGFTDSDGGNSVDGALADGEISTDGSNSDSAATIDASIDSGPLVTCDGGLSVCGTNCIDLTGDSANCGRCDRVCSSCTSGMCPETVLITDQSAPVAIDPEPDRLLVDATYLYWTSSHCVTRSNLDGTAANQIACPTSPPDGHLAMDSTNLYWASSTSTTSGSLFIAAKTGTTATSLLDFATLRPYGVAAEDASKTVFFGNLGIGQDPTTVPSRIEYTAVTSPSEKTLGTDAVKYFGGLSYTATDVYTTASDTGWLVKISRTTGIATTVATGFSNPIDVAVDGGFAYVVDAGFDVGPVPGTITQVDLATGAKTPLATGLASPYGITTDPDYVYFTTNGTSTNSYDDGTVMRIAKAGGAPLPLAINEADPRGIAVDSSFVYWVDFGTSNNPGAVVRTPR